MNESVDNQSNPRPSALASPLKVFISYAHEDEAFRNELHGHLAPLRAQRLIVDWHDRQIRPGMDWDTEIGSQIDSADVILFLVSADFMSSSYIQSVEYRRGLDRAMAGQARVIPVIVRETYLEGTDLGRLQAVPRDLQSVDSFLRRDEAWVQVVAAVAGEARRRAGSGRDEPAPAPAPAPAIETDFEAPSPQQWRAFAGRLISRLQLLDSDTGWSNDLFVEIAAEVEADVDCGKGRRALKHVPSLERALQEYTDKIVLVEGEPGSGKSVSLRRLAMTLATRASRGSDESYPVLPLYIDLRTLDEPLPRGEEVQALRRFIARQIGAATPQDQSFIHRWLDWGLDRGLWLLLLDSFDEIPAVLSSSEPDEPVRRHAEALHDFAGSMHQSRVIVASRAYRGPGKMPWPSFRILPLGEHQRRKIVGARFSKEDSERILAELGSIASLAACMRNPMLLNLICAHREATGEPPASPHEAFESFVDRRMGSRGDLLSGFGLTAARLRDGLERMAFCLTADAEVGLAVSLPVLERVLSARRMKPDAPLSSAVDCARALRLARGSGNATAFSFAHRRLQEYFATCFVLDGAHVPVERLLTDERWRETVVTVFETGDPARLGPIVAAASELLSGHLRTLQNQLPDLFAAAGTGPPNGRAIVELRSQREPREFPWPPGLLHILGVLAHLPSTEAAGESGPIEEVRAVADRILIAVVASGLRLDCAWALELSAAASPETRLALLTWAFASGSAWLEDAAFEQTSSLREAPAELIAGIRVAIVARELSGVLQREPTRVEAKIRRLDHSGELLLAARRLRHLRKLDVACLALTVCVLSLLGPLVPGWHGHLLSLGIGAGSAALAYWLTGMAMTMWLQLIRIARTAGPQKRGRLASWLQGEESTRETRALWFMIVSIDILRVSIVGFLVYPILLDLFSRFEQSESLIEQPNGAILAFFVGIPTFFATALLCFRPGAYLVAVAGGWTGRVSYPFVGLAPAVMFLNFKAMYGLTRAGGLLISLFFTIIIAVPALILLADRVLADFGVDAANVGIVVAILVMIGGAVIAASVPALFVRDLLVFSGLRKARRFDMEQLLRAVDRFSTSRGRGRFVGWVREHGRLHPSPQAQRALMEAITTVERDHRSERQARLSGTKYVPEPDPGWSRVFAEWYRARLLQGKRGLATWHGEILDDLSRIAMQLRLRVGNSAGTSSGPSVANIRTQT